MARLTLLGGFQGRLGGATPLTLPTRKTKALLAFLALPPGRSHPRAKLASLLWGDLPEPQARRGLRQSLELALEALAKLLRHLHAAEGHERRAIGLADRGRDRRPEPALRRRGRRRVRAPGRRRHAGRPRPCRCPLSRRAPRGPCPPGGPVRGVAPRGARATARAGARSAGKAPPSPAHRRRAGG